METPTTNTLLAILRKLNPLLGDKKWNLSGVNDRTQRRWLQDGEAPTGPAAKAVAGKIWEQITKPGADELKQAVFKSIREIVPSAPCDLWNEVSFGAWFFNLAEQARQSFGSGADVPPLHPTLDLLVRDPATGQFSSVSENPSLLPVKEGDELQLRVRLNRPAYICLVWVDQQGRPFPMYPWNWTQADWSELLVLDERNEVTVPEQLTSTGHSDLSVNGPPGVETLVLLVSQQRPAADDLKNFPQRLAGFKPPKGPPKLAQPFCRAFPRGQSSAPAATAGRGPVLRHHDDPLAAMHDALGKRLAEHFDQTLTFSFPNAGPASKPGKGTSK